MAQVIVLGLPHYAMLVVLWIVSTDSDFNGKFYYKSSVNFPTAASKQYKFPTNFPTIVFK